MSKKKKGSASTLSGFWIPPFEDEIVLPQREFNFCDVGPKHVKNILSAEEIFLLWWQPLLGPLVQELNIVFARTFTHSGNCSKQNTIGFQIGIEDLLTWIGIWIEMGLKKQSSVKDYWKEEGNKFVKNVGMPRDDWLAIWRGLWHISENFLNSMEKELNTAFRKFWNPFRYLALDEMMRLFKGRWKSKVYSPDKPTKWGAKFYLMVDNVHFCSWFKLFKSKEEKETEVTRHLCNDALATLPKHMGAYCFYADNYYGGLELARDINKQGHHFTMTAKANRSSDIFSQGLHQQLSEYLELENFATWLEEEEGIVGVSWRDKSLVNFYSNQFCNEVVTVQQKQHKEANKSAKTIPRIAQDYSQNGMGHVDAYDSHMQREDGKHKNFVWRRTIFLAMLKISIVNSFAFKRTQRLEHTSSDYQQRHFLHELKFQLVQSFQHRQQSAVDEKLKARREKQRISMAEMRKRRKKDNQVVRPISDEERRQSKMWNDDDHIEGVPQNLLGIFVASTMLPISPPSNKRKRSQIFQEYCSKVDNE
jgi:hypothetical protein